MTEAKVSTWLAEPLDPTVRRAIERLARVDDVRRIAVMPDVHLANEVCVGLAVATGDTLLPAAVGGDIGCGMAALGFDASADVLGSSRAAASVLDRLYRTIPVLRHPRTSAPRLPDRLLDGLESNARLQRNRTEAILQFGSLGRGNHFVEFQADDAGRLWVMVHSGSRGIGQAIRELHEKAAATDESGLVRLDANSEVGRAYLSDVDWACEYAMGSRELMLEAVRGIVRAEFGCDADETTLVACHHNFVRREVHDGEALWVHRKGAVSAREGELGIIPGSMGAPSFHVEGRGCSLALCSSSHGAGRAMSRAVARRRIRGTDLAASMRGVWFDHRIADRLVEEAPAAYKDIGKVMRAQRELTRIVRKLRPVLAFKGA